MINFTITTLIILGGIGFLVTYDVKKYVQNHLFYKRHTRLSLHSKMTIIVTLALIAGGLLAFFCMEYKNALVNMPLSGKIMAAYFQSVTARTAGFNTVDFYKLTNQTLLIMAILMFCGASSGSTGGGVKTSTIGVVVALAISKFRARDHVNVFHRTISQETVAKSISIVFMSTLMLVLFIVLLLVAESSHLPHHETRGRFIQISFEAFSAFGTVGLSTGITPVLTKAGKLLIILLMYIGRLGPLTVGMAISMRRAKGHYSYPEEDVMIG